MKIYFSFYLYIFGVTSLLHLATYAQTIHQKFLVDSLVLDLNNDDYQLEIVKNYLIAFSTFSKTLKIYDLNNQNILFEKQFEPYWSFFGATDENVILVDKYRWLKFSLIPFTTNQSIKNYRFPFKIYWNGFPQHFISFNDTLWILTKKITKYNSKNHTYYIVSLDIKNSKFKIHEKLKIRRFLTQTFYDNSYLEKATLFDPHTIFFNYSILPINYVLKKYPNQTVLTHIFINNFYDNEKVRKTLLETDTPQIFYHFIHSNYTYSPIYLYNDWIYQVITPPLNEEEIINYYHMQKDVRTLKLKSLIQFWDKNFKDKGLIKTDNTFLEIQNDDLYEYQQKGNLYTIYKYKIYWQNH